MEGFEQTEQTSVNTGEVAETQQTQTQEQSANNSEVANPNPVQDTETNAHYADMRRKQELEQYRQQAESYQQQLDRAARIAGYQSHQELVSALDQIEQEQQRQQYEQAGINPDVLNQFLESHPAIQYANQLQQQQQEQQRLGQEWGELVSEFPGITPDKIPPEVFQLQQQRGVPLLDAYLRVNYKSLGQQKEQEAIQKLQQNQLSSPGSLAQGTEHVTSYSQLSAQDKKALRERVLRGENVQF